MKNKMKLKLDWGTIAYIYTYIKNIDVEGKILNEIKSMNIDLFLSEHTKYIIEENIDEIILFYTTLKNNDNDIILDYFINEIENQLRVKE